MIPYKNQPKQYRLTFIFFFVNYKYLFSNCTIIDEIEKQTKSITEQYKTEALAATERTKAAMAANIDNEKKGLAAIKVKKEALLEKVKTHTNDIKEKTTKESEAVKEESEKNIKLLEEKLKRLTEQSDASVEGLTKQHEVQFKRYTEDSTKTLDLVEKELKDFTLKSTNVMNELKAAAAESESIITKAKKESEEIATKEKGIVDAAVQKYEEATTLIHTTHEEGKVLQTEIIALQEKEQLSESEVVDASQKEASALYGKKQTEVWIEARLKKGKIQNANMKMVKNTNTNTKYI